MKFIHFSSKISIDWLNTFNVEFISSIKNNGLQILSDATLGYPAFSIGGEEINDNYNAMVSGQIVSYCLNNTCVVPPVQSI